LQKAIFKRLKFQKSILKKQIKSNVQNIKIPNLILFGILFLAVLVIVCYLLFVF